MDLAYASGEAKSGCHAASRPPRLGNPPAEVADHLLHVLRDDVGARAGRVQQGGSGKGLSGGRGGREQKDEQKQ